MRASGEGNQGESKDNTNWSFLPTYWDLPLAHLLRRENAKLAVDSAWLGMKKMERLIDFLSHSHA